MVTYQGVRSGRSTGRPARERRGGVLVLALVAVVVIATLTAGMLGMGQIVTRRQAEAVNIKLSFYMAEAGLAEAYSGLLIGKTGNVGTQAQPAAFGNGLFWVTATDNGDDTVELLSTGMVGNGRAVLSMVAERGETKVDSLGMFFSAPVSVGAGALVDGYDSSKGTYASQVLGGLAPIGKGRLGSNGAIAVEGSGESPTVINAEVLPGPSQPLETTEFVTVHGVVAPARAELPLPPVETPDVPLGRGITHSSAVPLLVLPGTRGIEFLHVSSLAEAQIEGPATLVIGSLQLEPDARLTIDTSGGRVDIYVTGAVDFQAGSFVETPGQDPGLVSLQVAGQAAEAAHLAAWSEFRGVIYAPQAGVDVDGAFEVFGALIADQVTLNGAVQLHFDRQLAELSLESSLPELLSWRIVDLSSGGASGISPFANLGVDRAALPSPSAAHADQTIHVEFWTLAGVPSTYDGLESGFDWSDVALVEYLTRDGTVVKDLDPADALVDPVDKMLLNIIAGDMAARDVTRALLDNSPLSPTVLEAAMLKADPLLSDHYRRILLANSPLPPRVLEMVTLDKPSVMVAFDRDEVLAAQ